MKNNLCRELARVVFNARDSKKLFDPVDGTDDALAPANAVGDGIGLDAPSTSFRLNNPYTFTQDARTQKARPRKPFSNYVVIGTAAQINSWAPLLLSHIVDEFRFADRAAAERQLAGELERWSLLFEPTNQSPAVIWVTPIMPVVGRELNKYGIEPIEEISAPRPLAKKIQLPLSDRKIEFDSSLVSFANAPDGPAGAKLWVVNRRRFLPLGNSSKKGRLLSNEKLIYSAHEYEHALDLSKGMSPTVREYYNPGDRQQERSGWVECPHVTPILVDPAGPADDPFADGFAVYWGLRYTVGEGWQASNMFGLEQFSDFTDHHPTLKRVLRKAIARRRSIAS